MCLLCPDSRGMGKEEQDLLSAAVQCVVADGSWRINTSTAAEVKIVRKTE